MLSDVEARALVLLGIGRKQKEIATQVGRTQPWVSGAKKRILDLYLEGGLPALFPPKTGEIGEPPKVDDFTDYAEFVHARLQYACELGDGDQIFKWTEIILRHGLDKE